MAKTIVDGVKGKIENCNACLSILATESTWILIVGEKIDTRVLLYVNKVNILYKCYINAEKFSLNQK